jgi:DNA primase
MSEGNGSRPEGWVDFSRAKKVPFEAVVAALELSGKLRRYGDEYKGVCPLHGGEKESFGFNVEKGLFHCFGCKRSGNLLDFVNQGMGLTRDSVVSVMYAEELNSAKSSVTLQRTDRHGIVGQKPTDFQVSL